jgi:hypothetical protein
MDFVALEVTMFSSVINFFGTWRLRRSIGILLTSGFLAFGASAALAQTGGEGALEGTVTDSTGAAIPNATVTATDQARNASTTRTSTSAGLFSITPLIPGVYTVTVKANGFSTLTQKNVEVNGLTVTGLNPKLSPGAVNESVTVSEAPPILQTTSPSVEAVITQQTYASLPLVMNNQQRDPTALATLSVGAQGGTRAPIFSGTGNYLAEVYIDGIPTTTSNQQGDNRVVSNGVPVESVDQLQIISSGPSAEYQGAGAVGFTIKSGGSQYHGQIVDVFRNTALDTWGFQGNQQTKNALVNGKITQVPAGKPIEHQNELSVSAGGPIPFTHHKGFFFANYDKFHSTQTSNPAKFTVPTALMRQGDFTELNCPTNADGTYVSGCIGVGLTGTSGANQAIVYNPLTNACSGTTCSRQPFVGTKNGVPTNNVIPGGYISPISQKEEQYLPEPNVPDTLVNNYVQGGFSGYNNHELAFKIDYDWSTKQRYSFVYSHGVRQSIGYGSVLPLPYTNGDSSSISPTMLIFEHSYTINSRMVNQFTYGFTRFPQPVFAPTYNRSPYRASDMGITGLPVGQAAGNFPGTSFGGTTRFSTVQTQWTENGAADATHNVVPNAYTLVDNFQWTKGRHNITFGVETQRLEDNTTAQSSPSGIFVQNFAGTSTANYVGSALSSTNSGYSYASFLLGAVNSSSTSVPLFTETGGRYHPWSPYVQDDWKVRPNLTLNLGLRWDYLPPYHEVQDRWAFFNPNATNPITNSPGELQYAGNRGADISCQCRTPVHTYWKNFGPRLGLEWSMDPKTVLRTGFAVAYSRAGGVGGRAGDSTGTGQSGFGSSIVLPTAVNTGGSAGPSYYLNNSDAFASAGVANTNFGGPGYSIPAPIGPSAAGLVTGIGNYYNGKSYVTAGGAPAYADPYLSGRAPEFVFYNLAMQRSIAPTLSVTAGYSGSQSHFVAASTVPGFWSGQIDPAWLPSLASVYVNKQSIFAASATAANIAVAQAANPSIHVPYSGYVQPVGGTNSTASIGRMLRPFPQYSSPPGVTWDNIGNISYNAFELTLKQAAWKGISYTVNYTYSRNIGDDGTSRTAFPVPAAASSSGAPIPGNNRADRDLTATDVPENLNVFGYAQSPFGRNKIGGNNWAVRTFAGGWQLSGIFSYTSGTPILVVGSGCTAPSSGTCMPDVVPNRRNDVRINGGYGRHGVTYANYAQTPYLDTTAFQTLNYFDAPAGDTPITKIGDSPRSSLNLWSPSRYNFDASLQRSFKITRERWKFILRVDCFDVTNKVNFSIGQTQTVATTVANTGSDKSSRPLVSSGTPIQPGSSPAFGKLSGFSGNRRFQLEGRITF